MKLSMGTFNFQETLEEKHIMLNFFDNLEWDLW